MPVAVAEFIDVSKTYRTPLRPAHTVQALKGVSFRVEPGEVFALLGPNRAGKTTLVKILLGLCHATAGQVVRLGQPVADRATLGRVGYLHEKQAFPPYLTASALLDFYGNLSLIARGSLKTRIPELLERVGLADRAQEPIARFSKGMVQRLALAQALLTQPDLLVLDEPTEGLDLGGRVLLREVVAEQRRAGKTVLFVSHVLGEVEQLCERLAVIVKGQLAYFGSMAALLRPAGADSQRSLEDALKPIYGV
jgi:ABC-2 type transport system ATP-binding protein